MPDDRLERKMYKLLKIVVNADTKINSFRIILMGATKSTHDRQKGGNVIE